MRKNRMQALAAVLILVILSLACNATRPGLKESNIKNAYLTADENSKKAASVFPAGSPILCVVELVDMPADATVGVIWKAIKADGLEKYEKVYEESTGAVTGEMAFELLAPEELGLGSYQVDITLDGIPYKTLDFTVEEAAGRFQKSDCAVSGVPFNNISVDYDVSGMYNGPTLICSLSDTGAHGLSESAYISILTLKKDKLDEIYLEKQQSIKGFIDQANEWNASPNLPADLVNGIAFIRDDEDGYIFMITGLANVQNCLDGRGYGVEKINDKYLVDIHFISCELGDAGAYMAALENLQQTALTAIQRVEEANAKQK